LPPTTTTTTTTAATTTTTTVVGLLYCVGYSSTSDCCDAIDSYTFSCTYCETC
jgi:hypothetical protein